MSKLGGKGFASDTLPCNVLMNFYVDVGEPDEVSAIIDEMKEKKISLLMSALRIFG